MWLALYLSSITIGKVSNMSKSLVGNHIRKLRFNHDEMTQQQLADKAGVTRQTIVALEKGNYSPSLELAFRIAIAFNLPLEEVFFYGETTNLKKQ